MTWKLLEWGHMGFRGLGLGVHGLCLGRERVCDGMWVEVGKDLKL